MRFAVVLVATLTGVLCAPRADTATQQPFIDLIRELEQQPFFRDFSTENRVLTFEMLTAAETQNLTPLLNKLGYIQLFKYLDLLPAEYSHQFISYSIVHLEQEAAASNKS
ncbi:uncharacterized protein LOC143299477 [Babylonia areolata]|uniref:uncharacterized protein LOC143299477 n=1 Tax=Babylonia areolata TaxID=304850 RepID=UPI003FD0337A